MLVGDCSDTNTGKYNLYSQRVSNPSGTVILNMAQTQTNLIGSTAQSNTYIFSGIKNENVNFTLQTTNGSIVPKIALYNPDGSLNASNYAGNPGNCGGSTLEMDATLPGTGRYTVLVADCSDTNTGNYAIYAQSTNDPFGPAPVDWGQVQSGTVKSGVQNSTYTFWGVSKNVVDFTLTTTNGSLVPRIRVYNPDGSLNASNYAGNPGNCGGSTVQLDSVMLAQNGGYTVLVDDCSDTNTGTYNLSSQCFGKCLAMPAITWPTPAPIIFCTDLGSRQLDATANEAGDFTYSAVSGTRLSLGPHILSTTFTPSDKTDYSNARDFVQLTVAQAPTSTELSSSTNPSIFGETVTFGARITSSCGRPTGSVTFKNGSSTLGTVEINSGEARFSTAGLATGTHSIRAVFSGSTDFLTSSSILTQTVRKAPTATLAVSSMNPSKSGESVTLTATVTSRSGTPTGKVTFKNGSAIMGTGTLSDGKAKFTTSSLKKGTHSITAEYGGNADFLSSTSPALSQVVK